MIDQARMSFRPLWPFLITLLCGVAMLSLSRLGLSLWQADAVNAAHGWTPILLNGLRVDVASMCLLLGLAAAFYLLLPTALTRRTAVHATFAVWLTLALVIPFALELTTPTFMAEYGLRPNRLVIEYIVYPREIMQTLLKGHLLAVLTALALIAVAFWFVFRKAWRLLGRSATGTLAWPTRLLTATAIILLSTLGVRSTLGHRPMNPAMVAFSSNATVNVLPLNSFYALAHAARDHLRDDPGARIYDEKMSEEAVISAIREQVQEPIASFADADLPVLVQREPVYRGKPRNLVIVLEESLGAQFVGSLGGLPLTPNFDRLADEGWAFERLYATGTRSVRGIEAVLAGFPPTPSPAVVKLPLAQQGFFTLAALLGQQGYDTSFHYGGESHFDNMRGFFLGNGFERVLDRAAHPTPTFEGSWGVSDEDVFARSDLDFRDLHARGQRFFGFIFTSSNHDPFEFPEGSIALYEQPKGTRNNAAKYADHALGKFFEAAKNSPYWQDTVFLVVADHDSRVLGQSLVPIDNFHIPGLILGADIPARRDDRLVSQIDLAPTLLSLIGIDAPTPLIGDDLNHAERAGGRAMMQYDNNYAWMTDESVVILQPGKAPTQYRYTPGEPLTLLGDAPDDLSQRALQHALWGTLAYERQWHRLPSPRAYADTRSASD